MRTLLKALFLTSVTLLLFSSTAQACSCSSSPSPCEAFRQAKAVFVGKVISFNDTPVEEEFRNKNTLTKKEPSAS